MHTFYFAQGTSLADQQVALSAGLDIRAPCQGMPFWNKPRGRTKTVKLQSCSCRGSWLARYCVLDNTTLPNVWGSRIIEIRYAGQKKEKKVKFFSFWTCEFTRCLQFSKFLVFEGRTDLASLAICHLPSKKNVF